jgi:hypothetical protein
MSQNMRSFETDTHLMVDIDLIKSGSDRMVYLVLDGETYVLSPGDAGRMGWLLNCAAREGGHFNVPREERRTSPTTDRHLVVE